MTFFSRSFLKNFKFKMLQVFLFLSITYICGMNMCVSVCMYACVERKKMEVRYFSPFFYVSIEDLLTKALLTTQNFIRNYYEKILRVVGTV